MSNPRNPRYFPRMKVRGAQRRRVASLQRMTGSFDRLSESTAQTADALVKLRVALGREGATQ